MVYGQARQSDHTDQTGAEPRIKARVNPAPLWVSAMFFLTSLTHLPKTELCEDYLFDFEWHLKPAK